MTETTPKASAHRWTFWRAGGVDQVRLETGADVLALDQLDLKLWVALSCPVKGLELDARTLELLDTDLDGHVRPPEILAAVRWLRDVLRDADPLMKGEDGVALANLRDDTAEGKIVRGSAQHMLQSLGKDATVITIADATKTAEVFLKAKRNGDGVVPPSSIDDAGARAIAEAVIACVGAAPDRSGTPGFGQAQVDAFFDACTKFDAWHRAAEADAKNVMPLGDRTPAAHAALLAVRTKVDDYFGRCRVAAYDPRALGAVNREEEVYLAAVAKDLTITANEIAHLPLAVVAAGKPLPLASSVNPAWATQVAAMRELCCKDKDALTEAEWVQLCARFDAYAAWLATKAGAAVETLGVVRVREILAGKGKQALQQAIADDLALAPLVEAMTRVEKLARLQRDFVHLLNNYVAFTDFYARRGAIFQAGTLFLDARECDMCFFVRDAAKHTKMAPMANTFLAYVDCTRPGSEKMSIAAAFTAGDSDNLFEGRNGLFFDRKGRDWDATIAKIVPAPISVRQAFWSPYKNVLRAIQQMVAKRAADADAASASKLATGAAAVGTAAQTGAPGVPPKPKFEVGTIAALGVAVTGITGVFTALLTGFLDLGPWIPLGIVGIVLAISGPSMFIAWAKLRQRNLGPILDANGWAVNTLTRINIPLGTALTELPRIPTGSRRIKIDPYAPRRSVLPKLLFVLLALGAAGWLLYRSNAAHKMFPWIPAHDTPAQDVGNALTIEGDRSSIVAGDPPLVFVVKNKAPELFISNPDTRDYVTKIGVADGKATLVITPEMKPGKYMVSDGASSVTITVLEKK